MGIFPSKHEERLTLAILAFTSGTGFGLFVYYLSDDFDSALPALTTLIAAFLGAWLAFLFQRKHEEKKVRDLELAAANKLLYIMLERLNTLALFQKDIIEPHRLDPAKMITMRPNLNFSPPMTEIDISDLSFMFKGEHKTLMTDLYILDALYRDTVYLIQHRSHIHLNVYQPSIQASGYRAGLEITNQQIKEILGERDYRLLEQLTDQTIEFVDGFIEDGDKLRKSLIDAFNMRFSKAEIFGFELLKPPKAG